jgi:hypothetical protein
MNAITAITGGETVSIIGGTLNNQTSTRLRPASKPRSQRQKGRRALCETDLERPPSTSSVEFAIQLP